MQASVLSQINVGPGKSGASIAIDMDKDKSISEEESIE